MYVTGKLTFSDVFLTYRVFRHYYGKPNDINNVRLKDAIYSTYDLIPYDEVCVNKVIKFKKSLIVRRNTEGEDPFLCLDRFIDISDKIERMVCDFGSFDNDFY